MIFKMTSNQLYTPLNSSRREIRVLEIIATSPRIICKLSTVSLNESPRFCALSYVWGDPKLVQYIWVNNVYLSVTKSLADALSYIQIQWEKALQGQDVTKLRLWADAICINQLDNVEKNYQVPLMKDIYSSAEVTFCSLDSLSSASELPISIDWITNLADRIYGSGFDPKQDQDVDLEPFQDLFSLHEDRQSLQGDTGEADAQFWDSYLIQLLGPFTSLTYWDRAWIFQEVVLSRKPILFYADRSIHFDTLGNVVEWAQEVMRQQRPDDFALGYWLAIKVLSFGSMHKLLLARRSLAAQRISGPLHKEFQALVIRALNTPTSVLKATNPKDYVYALVGVSGLDIVPHYEDDMSVASVYAEFCAKQMPFTRYSSGIRLAKVNMPLSFLELAGLVNGNPGEYGLPSWVPNFPACAINDGSYRISCLDGPGAIKEKEDTWLDKFTGSEEGVSISDKSLFVNSLFIESVEDSSDILSESSESQGRFVLSVFRLLKSVFEALENPYSERCHPFLRLTSALYGSKIESPIWESPKVLRASRLLQAFLREPSGLNSHGTWDTESIWGNDFLEKIYCEPEKIMEMGFERQSKLGMLRFGIKVIDIASLGGRDNLISTLEDAYSFSRTSIRIARTVGNKFAIVPPVTLAGDKIVLLAGYDHLCLIRKVDSHYVYVGPVCVSEDLVDHMLVKHSIGEAPHVPIELR
ncbi:hypothetical protein DM02DRAFT_573940, partial [Periconia macrospinosa]